MEKPALMGIENEFTLSNQFEPDINGELIYKSMLNALPVLYFEKSNIAVRLATGGAFYIHGNETEITSAPNSLEKSAVTAVVTNLIINRNTIIQALKNINAGVRKGDANQPKYQLNGYSAHYNFSFPQFSSSARHRDNLCYLLAETINPALQLLIENRHSSGIMFRYTCQNRIEICAEYVPSLEDMISGVGFQAAALFAMDKWIEKGADFDDINHKLKYILCEIPHNLDAKVGWILKTPQVISEGRKALIECNNFADTKKPMFGHPSAKLIKVQALLEHYCEIFEWAMEEILSEQEKKLLMDAVQKKRKIPIDHRGYPEGYFNVKIVNIGQRPAEYPLAAALGNAVSPRSIHGMSLTPESISWDYVGYSILPQDAKLSIPLHEIVFFENLLNEHPATIKRLLAHKLTAKDKELLEKTHWHNWFRDTDYIE